jgi:putrescine aminotransferase
VVRQRRLWAPRTGRCGAPADDDAAVLQQLFPDHQRAGGELAAKLASLAPTVGDRSFQHVFYSSSGSESNDSNVRMVRRYWDLLGQPQRKLIIGRKNGYHGSTMAGASLGGMSGMHAQGDLPIPNITISSSPTISRRAARRERDEFGCAPLAGWRTRFWRSVPDKVAAFIAEPVQGAGGVIIPPDTYWPEIQRIVDKYGILLISDEVICAFGRLGHWFAYEKFGYKPDLVTFAKAVTSGYIPLGGVMVGNRVAKVLIDKGASSTTATPTAATRWPARWRWPTSS